MSSAQTPQAIRMGAAADILIVLVVAFGVKAIFHPISWQFASLPAAIAGLVVATLLLRRRGLRWADLGLKLPTTLLGYLTLPVLAAIAFILAVGIGGGVALYLNSALGEAVIDPEERFGNLQGNISLLALWIFLGWAVGGFFEEMFFRGFLITRLDHFFNGDMATKGLRWTLLLSVALPAIIFGGAHFYYQGLRGAIIVTAMGLAFGACYVLFGRRLWPVIIAHGSIDTLSFVAQYLDADW